MRVSLIPKFRLTGVNYDRVSRILLVPLFAYHGSLSSDKR